MEHVNILRDYGLFDAKVPRYTSYPPANRFEANTGARVQAAWLRDVPQEAPISVYVHIPFCRRLCWFCACRTQGTQTLSPVDVYIDDLAAEIELVAKHMSGPHRMARLHLGGGTPTLLTASQMARLLDMLDSCFARTSDCEFSVEIDPTDAAPEVLSLLVERGMGRASIGVQDFDPRVQEAIGRHQSYAQTEEVVARLREDGVVSLNIDLLYGLPHQTLDTLTSTLEDVHALRPDRLALYGYAHVPHMSKRQVMIPDAALPSTKARFEMSAQAEAWLKRHGYEPVGIDHFARASDSLAKAAKSGALRRNFQGYTDDPCATLMGFGASAISKFPTGYVQNAVATRAYQDRVRLGRLPGHKGCVLADRDRLIATVVEHLMCRGCLDPVLLSQAYPGQSADISLIADDLYATFPKAFEWRGQTLAFRPGMEVLARIAAAHVDTALSKQHVHSLAI